AEGATLVQHHESRAGILQQRGNTAHPGEVVAVEVGARQCGCDRRPTRRTCEAVIRTAHPHPIPCRGTDRENTAEGVACRAAGAGQTYPVAMARSHLTLAALATSAVAELDVVGAAPFGSAGRGDFDAAVITGRDGRHWIVRVPRSERAEQQQSADLVALRALSQGMRARLPFDVTVYAGQAPVDGTRAIVSEFVAGTPVTLAGIDLELADSIGRAIAAVHALPTSLVTDAGLPAQTSVD